MTSTPAPSPTRTAACDCTLGPNEAGGCPEVVTVTALLIVSPPVFTRIASVEKPLIVTFVRKSVVSDPVAVTTPCCCVLPELAAPPSIVMPTDLPSMPASALPMLKPV